MLRCHLQIYAGALALAFATSAAAESTDSSGFESRPSLRERAQRSRATLERIDQQRGYWQDRYRRLLVELSAARAEQKAATADRRRDRNKNRLRGELRRAADRRIEESEVRSQTAYDEIVGFYERARSQAIERSWLQQVEDEFGEMAGVLPDRG